MPNRSSFKTDEERREWYRKYRAKNRLKLRLYNREYNRLWRSINGYHNERKYQRTHPLRIVANKKVEYAIRTGRLKPQSCEECGETKTHAHHEDYNKPLSVVWLCAVCHRQRHLQGCG